VSDIKQWLTMRRTWPWPHVLGQPFWTLILIKTLEYKVTSVFRLYICVNETPFKADQVKCVFHYQNTCLLY